MEKEPVRRTYKESYFWMLVLCLVITVISEYTGVTVQQMTDYADTMIRKTLNNMNSLIIWLVPISIMVKKEVSSWRKDKYSKEIEIAKLKGEIKKE